MSTASRFDLTGRVYIVTGATGGLGEDIARVLHGCGARVVLVGRSADAGRAIAGELGDGALYCETDITDDASIDACLEATLAAFGRLDGLVNNACIYTDPGLGATREQWLNLLNVNVVSGAVFVAKARPHLVAAGGGVIVNLSSTSAKSGRANTLLYPASKAAILNVTRNEAATLAKDNIRVVAVIPAWTWSPSIERLTGSIEKADAVGSRFHPLGRIGRGAEVGWTVAFALSDAASFITGSEICVDGGYSMLGPDQGRDPRVWLAESNG